jgi:hypothetical protein
MTDYQIQTNTRRCAVTGRELQPGDRYFSVLFDENGALVRRDYAAEAWTGAPQGAYSYWSGRIAQESATRKPPIDDDMLFECLSRMAGEKEPAKIKFRYVIALLLMRRKRLKFAEAHREGEQEVLVLQSPQRGERFSVIDPQLSDEEMTTVQDEVFEVLGW